VYDKTGVYGLARALAGAGWEILSTGETAAALREAGIAVTDVSAATGFPECLDGRVKTLHPAIHGGLLARRDRADHRETLKRLGIGAIDLVCVNLYPFRDKLGENLNFDGMLEFIDIGGPAMIRGAAKNFRDVVVLTDSADYGRVIAAICGDGTLDNEALDENFRQGLAAKVFRLTAAYDRAIAEYLAGAGAEAGKKTCPALSCLPLGGNFQARPLRYGENPHQKAEFRVDISSGGVFTAMKQLQGKELSYNNIRDIDTAVKMLRQWGRMPPDRMRSPVFCTAVKHNTPCGAALGDTAMTAYRRAWECDPQSVFGGILGMSAAVDEETACLMAETFLEVIIAPGYTQGALRVFGEKKNLRVLEVPLTERPGEEQEALWVDGGFLTQTGDRILAEKWEVVTRAKPAPEDESDMRFGMLTVMFAKSNAVVVVRDGMALGIGAGQTSRIWAAEQALSRAKARAEALWPAAEAFGSLRGFSPFKGEPYDKSQNSTLQTCQAVRQAARVLVSDAFFPFRDCVDRAAEYGIRAILQPGGSLRDRESIDACDEHGIAMVLSGTRHFKH
jgi:phosphoribosylaminoimidazolecarboxamide formyltransferase/IMP cyclohydrolase